MVLLHLISKKIKSNRQTHMIFVKNYRPTRYENWQITGLLNHLHTRGTIIYCLFRSGDYLLLGVALIFFFFFFFHFCFFSSSFSLRRTSWYQRKIPIFYSKYFLCGLDWWILWLMDIWWLERSSSLKAQKAQNSTARS